MSGNADNVLDFKRIASEPILRRRTFAAWWERGYQRDIKWVSLHVPCVSFHWYISFTVWPPLLSSLNISLTLWNSKFSMFLLGSVLIWKHGGQLSSPTNHWCCGRVGYPTWQIYPTLDVHCLSLCYIYLWTNMLGRHKLISKPPVIDKHVMEERHRKFGPWFSGQGWIQLGDRGPAGSKSDWRIQWGMPSYCYTVGSLPTILL